MGATETRQKPTIRVLQPKGPVELFVGGRRIDLRTINGQQVEGIWIGKPAEGPDVLAAVSYTHLDVYKRQPW